MHTHTHMCVCVCACAYLYQDIEFLTRSYIYTHSHSRTCVCVCGCSCIKTSHVCRDCIIYVCMDVCTFMCMHTRMHVCMCVCVCMYTLVSKYVYTCTCTCGGGADRVSQTGWEKAKESTCETVLPTRMVIDVAFTVLAPSLSLSLSFSFSFFKFLSLPLSLSVFSHTLNQAPFQHIPIRFECTWRSCSLSLSPSLPPSLSYDKPGISPVSTYLHSFCSVVALALRALDAKIPSISSTGIATPAPTSKLLAPAPISTVAVTSRLLSL